VLAHARVAQQFVADEQVTAKDRAAVLGERGAGYSEARAQRIHQGLGDRADVAGRCGIEGRAVFEVALAHAVLLQPAQRGKRFADGIGGGDRAGLQRDDDGVGIRRGTIRHADHLHRAHAGAHQHARHVGGAGEVVRNHAQRDFRAFAQDHDLSAGFGNSIPASSA
jgi:hypothetical protein